MVQDLTSLVSTIEDNQFPQFRGVMKVISIVVNTNFNVAADINLEDIADTGVVISSITAVNENIGAINSIN